MGATKWEKKEAKSFTFDASSCQNNNRWTRMERGGWKVAEKPDFSPRLLRRSSGA